MNVLKFHCKPLPAFALGSRPCPTHALLPSPAVDGVHRPANKLPALPVCTHSPRQIPLNHPFPTLPHPTSDLQEEVITALRNFSKAQTAKRCGKVRRAAAPARGACLGLGGTCARASGSACLLTLLPDKLAVEPPLSRSHFHLHGTSPWSPYADQPPTAPHHARCRAVVCAR